MQDKMLKILFVPSDNNATSGAFISMVKLCSILQGEFGCQVQVLLRCKGNGQYLLSENNISFKVINSFNWFIPYKPRTLKRKFKRFLCNLWMPLTRVYNKIAVKRISCYIQKEQFDIVHINTSCTYVGAVAALKNKVPFVWHIREFLEEDQERCIWNKKYAYELMAQADKVITISNGLYDKYSKNIPKANIVKIYNGIDDKRFRCLPRQIFMDSIIHLVIVGSINKSKGQDQAILACKELYDKGIRNFELNIVGKNSEYAKILEKQVEKLGLNNNIKFTGPCKEVEHLYQKADIALMCSASEAFGRVTVEAMMSGALVIGANSGGTLELIEDGVTGILYESGNSSDLAKKIIVAIREKERMNKIAQRGQDFMIKNMTADKNAENIYYIYKEILASERKKDEEYKSRSCNSYIQ